MTAGGRTSYGYVAPVLSRSLCGEPLIPRAERGESGGKAAARSMAIKEQACTREGSQVRIQLCTTDDNATFEAWQIVELIPVGTLRPANSPRLGGISRKHAEVPAESEDKLPAVLVQKGTIRVIAMRTPAAPRAARLRLRGTARPVTPASLRSQP